MSRANLLRFGGLAAILAGVLRGLNSFIPSDVTDDRLGVAIALLYLLTDIFLLFGVMGLYGFQYQESGGWGFWGFLLMVVGVAMIRTGVIAGVSLYGIGALVFAAGLMLLAIGSWMARRLPRWIPVVWVLSTIVGFLGYFVAGFEQLFVISGVIFGIGFAGAGLKIWSD